MDGQMSIFDFLDKPVESSRAVCRYSDHTCNKEVLWSVADDLDDTNCPRTCCRMCGDLMCGARCNGAIEKPFSDNQTINELHEELIKMFPNINDMSYRVWSHVPNLGKRFEGWIRPFTEGEGIGKLVKKYEAKHLEVTFCVVPRVSGDGKDYDGLNCMVSTLWKTKGHREV